MSFQDKNFWLPKSAGCLNSEEMGYDNPSRVEPKRGHQWFPDASGAEFFCNKKQAIESVNSGPSLGVSNANVSLWENTSNIQSDSTQFTDRLFGSEPFRSSNLNDRSIPTIGTADSSLEKKGFAAFAHPFGNDPWVGLSMSHAAEDPSSCLNYAGLRKVRVNQVRDSEEDMSSSMVGHLYRGDNNIISTSAPCSKSGSNIAIVTSYLNGESTIEMGPSFNKADNKFISMGHTFNKEDRTFMLMGHNYNKVDNFSSSMERPFHKGDTSFISANQQCEKLDSNIISTTAPAYNNFFAMNTLCNKANENFIPVGPHYGKSREKGNGSVISINTPYSKEDSLSMSQNYKKGESSTLSFGAFQGETNTQSSGRIIESYNMLMSHPLTQISNPPVQEDFVEHIADPIVNVAPVATSKTGTNTKNKEQKPTKKASSNNFPSNVKSLLSTGMLDGVPVKYVSWSREKNLQGIIKGCGYLCDCSDCKLSKVVNAYEFERHAGCKTKHPNNHIYFENGKTIYGVVQELKSTPQDRLFDVIQNVTGSLINQKNFLIWKESFQAATLELKRIYGKDEVVGAS